jgi:hypothetical protein
MMRAFGGIVAALWLSACSKDAVPSAQQSTQRVEVESDIVFAPSEPTPAFVPPQREVCPHGYRPVEGSCVHHAYVAADDASLASALAAYRRGAVPPMLGPEKPKAPPERRPLPLDPGSLSKRAALDAGVARERRVAELDAMIAVAKEKLRERDERSKAKKVESPKPPAVAASSNPASGSAAAQGAAGFTGQAPNTGDPTQARLSELSQLASQLPPEQLQEITAQLSKAGIDARELEVLLQSARTAEPAP